MSTFLEKAVATTENVTGYDGLENASSVPFVKLLQTLSPEIDKDKEKFIEGAEKGGFVNSGNGEYLGTGFKVIVVGFERVYVEWKPERGGLVGYHTPSEARQITVSTDFNSWATIEGNPLVETYLYKCLIVGQEERGIVVLSFTSSNITTAKHWNKMLMSTLLDNGAKALPHFMTWEVSSVAKENKKGSFYVYAVKKDGFIDEAQFAIVSEERVKIEEEASTPAPQIENKVEEGGEVQY